ncbi:hypothetical protein J4474_01650 [Candidatus Pacearchaeota archaeon]|nr:hypothetical protein [Candidatus Pacearchaeota archaeon]
MSETTTRIYSCHYQNPRKNVRDKTTPAEKGEISIEKNNKWEGLLLAGLENGKQ